MKIPVIDLYSKNFKFAYIVNNKDKRERVILVGNDPKIRKGMLLARYMWEEKYGKIPVGLQIDHINNDKTDDRLSNLQLLTQRENTLKEHKRHPPKIVARVCPVCNKRFKFRHRNLSGHPNPCCSRECGYKKGALLKKLRSEYPLNEER